VADATLWWAPLGTGPDESGWVELGHVDDSALVFEAEPIPDQDWTVPALGAITITLHGRGRFGWRFWQLFWGTPGPHAARVKREYHRRRR
jgi:hypothetical protein